LGSPLIDGLGNRIAEIVATYGIPAISQFRSFPEGGGMMSYGPVLSGWYRKLAAYVSAIERARVVVPACQKGVT
jgi:putative ABC transport system substrate-binding protein